MVAYRYRLLALVQKQGQKLFTTEVAPVYPTPSTLVHPCTSRREKLVSYMRVAQCIKNSAPLRLCG